jgi:hypothetical protein
MILFFVLFTIACDGGNTKIQTDKTGEEDFPCFPNDTCNEGLECVDDVCVRLSNDTDTENSDIEDLNDDFTDDIQELDNENSDVDETESNDGFTDDIQEDDSDTVELDNEEIPDEVEDDTPTPDIYNCFNDDRYFYKNGDCWLKEENLIWFERVYNADIFATRNILREKCANVGGILPKVTDFRKNITDDEFCENQMPNDKCNNICPVFDDNIKRDDLLYKCKLNKNNTDNQFLYPNTYFISVLTDIVVGNNYIVSFGYFEQNGNIYNTIEYTNIKREMSPLTCIKNLTEL